eukprot:IDg14289t1
MLSVAEVAQRARAASRAVQALSAADRERALQFVEDELRARRAEIEEANAADRNGAADRGVENALAKRLNLSGRKYEAMLDGVASVRSLPDPVGEVTMSRRLVTGLELYRVSSPIGVLAIVFEARPEAGVQIACLALKSANALILKGGSEAERSNTAIAKAIRAGLERACYPVDAVQLLTTRGEVKELLAQTDSVDLVIPRGSNSLVQFVQNNTKIPVMGHADGLCSLYIDGAAAAEKAVSIAVDAKTQYPAVCNAVETILVAEAAGELTGQVCAALVAAGVEVRADARALKLLAVSGVTCSAASDEDFDTEFLELIVAVKVVDGVDAAI